MTNKEIFNQLSELEEAIYYRMNNPEGLPFSVLLGVYQEINTALCQWHNITGCKNEGGTV